MADVSTKTKAVAELGKHLALITALRGGTEAMRAAGKTFMPQWPMEDNQDYDNRLATATLLPAYTETVSQMVGRVFSKPLAIGEDVPEPIASLLPDVDREGRNLHVFAGDVFDEAMHSGVSYILVDYTRVAGAKTVADEKAAGARPYLVHVKLGSVLGWKKAGQKLVQFRYLETVTEDDGEFGEKSIEQIRVLEPGVHRIYRKPDGKTEWALHESIEVSLQVVPVVPVYTNRTGFMLGEPPLLELAHLNVKHWQSQSDQDTILHTARVPLLARIGAEDSNDVSIGKSLIDLPTGGDLKYVEHTGAAIKAGQESLDALEEQMKVAGAKLLTRSVLSLSESQAGDEKAKEISRLAAMAEGLEDALDQVLQLMADWIGAGNGGSVRIGADLNSSVLNGNVKPDDIYKAVNAGLLSKQSGYERLTLLGVALDDVDWETEQTRIETQSPTL